MNQGDASRKKKIQAGFGVLALGVVVVGTAIATSGKSSGMSNDQSSSTTATNSTSGANANTTYKNGSYHATGTYESPGGQESINVSLTLDNNVVTNTSATSGANDSTASSYQGLFIGGYKSQVVGKKISSIHLSNVSGSSLTSQGFDNALEQIEKQAKA